jgi:hypothetical protein
MTKYSGAEQRPKLLVLLIERIERVVMIGDDRIRNAYQIGCDVTAPHRLHAEVNPGARRKSYHTVCQICNKHIQTRPTAIFQKSASNFGGASLSVFPSKNHLTCAFQYELRALLATLQQ